jgi:hypothetical protein
MGSVSAPRRRRHSNFDFAAKRRREIVKHARHVGAAQTDDFDRWLIAWHWHNPNAKDQIWSLMECAKNMGGKITKAQASAITKEASITRMHRRADNLARYLGVTYAQRQALHITTIGSVNVGKRARTVLRKRRACLREERRRRATGAIPRAEYEAKSLSVTKPWKELGIGRRTWERRRNKARDASPCAANFLTSEHGPATPARGAGASERGFAPKKARGLPSSQTATTMAADAYAPLPLELRLLALGLVETDWPENLARVA